MTQIPTTLGDRLAIARRRYPLTQEELAEKAGISVEVIKKLERNERTGARNTTVAAFARALDVTTGSLYGDAAEAAAKGEPDDEDDIGMLDVRRVLTPARGLSGMVIGESLEGPATLDGVRRDVRLVDELYHRDQYVQALRALPTLITDARQLVHSTNGDDQGDAYGALASAYRTTGKTLLQVRRLDLAHIALTAALDAAERSSESLLLGAMTVRTMCWLLTRQGRFADAEALAVATADEVEPRFSKATPLELANWGWLMLYASGASTRDNRPEHARDQLDAAAAAALRIGQLPPQEFDVEMGGFSTPKVAMMRVESAVVQGEPGQALQLATTVEPSSVPTPSCRNRHKLDVAAAHLATGDSGGNARAGEVLLDLGRSAPQWMRNQRYARDLVDQVAAGRRRAMGQDLAKLAALVGASGTGGGSHPLTE